MKLHLFNKGLAGEGPGALIARAASLGVDGFHLCVRPGHILTPEGVETELPAVVQALRDAGLEVPMLTTRAELTDPSLPEVRRLLRAMDAADIRRVKIGYFRVPRAARLDFSREFDRVRRVLAQWAEVGKEFKVRICIHPHASVGDFFIGSNASSALHLVQFLDPVDVGVYLDAAHLELEGEPFDLAVAMVRPYLAGIALKDARRVRPAAGAAPVIRWETAGSGTVDWALVRAAITCEPGVGPLTIHAEYEATGQAAHLARLPQEVAFYQSLFRA